MVDPLDGTSNFIRGRPEFAVCIGLVVGGTTTLGVVYNPVSETLYHATIGGGAHRDGSRIEARPFRHRRPTMVASPDELDSGRLDAVRNVAEVVTLGSTALKMAHVAEGAADLYASVSRKGLWDICAAHLIATEAGAIVADSAGDAIDFSDLSRTLSGVIVSGPGGEDVVAGLGQKLRAVASPPEEEKR